MAWSTFRRVAALGPWLVLALLMAPGCAKEEMPKTYTVNGKVVLKNGKPLPGGDIVFTSVTNRDLRGYGQIAKDGTFTLNTIALTKTARSERLDGAIEGEFVVNIRPGAAGVPADPDNPPVGRGMIAFTLKKTYKIEPKENNEITVVIE